MTRPTDDLLKDLTRSLRSLNDVLLEIQSTGYSVRVDSENCSISSEDKSAYYSICRVDVSKKFSDNSLQDGKLERP